MTLSMSSADDIADWLRPTALTRSAWSRAARRWTLSQRLRL
jgi:hypothetical protein